MKLDPLLQWDVQASSRLRIKDTSDRAHRVMAVFAHSGDSWFWLIGLVLIWFVGDPLWHNNAASLSIGMVLLAAVVLPVKFLLRRPRPEGQWGQIYRITDPHSFPSGHAARAACLAALAWGLGPLWFAVILTIWAPLVCIARVTLGVHYLLDVAAGILIGIPAGLLILQVVPLFSIWLPFLYR
ncbi:MAG TPA: phosphatase PAP2 family protein [Anaerolineaceae bacterium]|nr:phosphatase PAP2 family protein [Anaerolineaceae bacterium]HPN52854.1 phosphatase PAP2 family protein [Anaerolineaceae bacterium]